ncbi:MAG: sulfate ABC transporter permease subunit [Acidimicrobiaceae bacterium]|nr:sulfate ABC transporter permease subunit [Acidimicrobiaceae bacterium]
MADATLTQTAVATGPASVRQAGPAPKGASAGRPALPQKRQRGVLGGGRGTLGLRAIALLYVGILVVLPLAIVTYRTFRPGLHPLGAVFTDPNTIHAIELSIEIAIWAVVLNTVFGVGMALLLTRYRFPGKALLGAFVDLTVSISPIVVGLALVLVYGPQGWFGGVLGHLGYRVIDSTPGMVLATVFVSMPLVLRAVAPVLIEAGTEAEQAAASLGAGAFAQFRRITLPAIRSAIAYGLVLSLARALGEYGAVLVVSGNIEGRTETATLRISNLYETEFQPDQAYALTFVLLVIAIIAIIVVSILRRRAERKELG